MQGMLRRFFEQKFSCISLRKSILENHFFSYAQYTLICKRSCSFYVQTSYAKRSLVNEQKMVFYTIVLRLSCFPRKEAPSSKVHNLRSASLASLRTAGASAKHFLHRRSECGAFLASNGFGRSKSLLRATHNLWNTCFKTLSPKELLQKQTKKLFFPKTYILKQTNA
jgi:hypothetical protein